MDYQGTAPYALRKFGAQALSESLAMELSDTTIHVMMVYPGGVKTNLIKQAVYLEAGQREQIHQAFSRAAILTPQKSR